VGDGKFALRVGAVVHWRRVDRARNANAI